MSEQILHPGDRLNIQFVWRIPGDDLMRAVFEAEIQYADQLSEKYVVLLNAWIAGRQESPLGDMRSLAEVSREYWALVARLSGQRVSLSYEAADGRPLWLRFETLTGDHNFFRRLNELPPAIEAQLDELPLKEIFKPPLSSQ